MRKEVEDVFFFIFSSSYLSSLFTFNEVLNLSINAWSLHINHSEHQISYGCLGTPVCFTERLPQSCMTTNLIEHLSKNNKEAACSKTGQFYQTSL